MYFAINDLCFFSVRNLNLTRYDFVIRVVPKSHNHDQNPIVTKWCIYVRLFFVLSTVCHLIK